MRRDVIQAHSPLAAFHCASPIMKMDLFVLLTPAIKEVPPLLGAFCLQ